MSRPKQVGDYAIERVLGQGGMGLVLEARHPSLPGPVALKLITSGTPTTRARFKREGQLLARVSHPNVIRVHEFGESEEGPFLVTERIEGESLREAHEQAPLDSRRAAEVVRDLAGAVAALHGVGVLHRDLKPENVLLRAPDQAPVLIDFGLAFTHEAERPRRTGAIVGTPQFMAPEQIEGAVFDERVDVYGLGGTLYALLSGETPFADAENAHALLVSVVTKSPDWARLEGVPSPLVAIARRCLEKLPEKRYPSALALQADLERFLKGELDGGARRVVWVVAALVLLALVLSLAAASWGLNR